ncbi:MAG: ParB/RepB/Spo0J family partition protein [bacterium]
MIPSREEGTIQEIEIERIYQNSNQPRETIDKQAIEKLADSIRQKGILQPILVRSRDNGFEIVAGERRYLAARLLGLKKLPAILLEVNEREAYEISLIENIQREDLNPIDKANAFQGYIERYGVTHEELAERLGISRSEITNLLRLLKLPLEVQERLKSGDLTYGHARALLGIDEQLLQKELTQKIIDEKLSVRETEELVRRNNRIGKIPEIKAIEDKLQAYLETKVRIRPRSPEKGKIVIEYRSLEELEKITGRFLE